MKYLLSLFFVLFLGTALADPPTPAQIASAAEILVKAQVPAPTQSTAQTIDEWANVGKNIGSSLGSAARESGAIVNDFVKTPVGTMIAGVIVYHYIGDRLIHTIVGCFLLFIVMPICLRCGYKIHKNATTKIVEHATVSRFWGMYTKVVAVESTTTGGRTTDDQDGMIIAFMIAAIIAFAGGVIIV